MPALRHKVTLQTNTPAQSATGAKSDSWADTAEVWADISPIVSREFVAAGQPRADVTHRVVIRYRSGVTTKQRFAYGTRYFYITGIVNGLAGKGDTTERNTWLTCMCRESI